MKKFLIKTRVYRTDGMLPDFFGREEKIIIRADSLSQARSQVERMIHSMIFRYVVIKGIYELTD
jgi:hypothetical protein